MYTINSRRSHKCRQFQNDPLPKRSCGARWGIGGEKDIKGNTKARITIHLDRDIISHFKDQASQTAKGYQTLINEALREYTGLDQPSMMMDLVERVKRLEDAYQRHTPD